MEVNSLADDRSPEPGCSRLFLGAEYLLSPGLVVIGHAGEVIDILTTPVDIALDRAATSSWDQSGGRQAARAWAAFALAGSWRKLCPRANRSIAHVLRLVGLFKC